MEQFDLYGNYLGEWPGWYNWPDEMVGDADNIIQHIETQRLHVFKTPFNASYCRADKKTVNPITVTHPFAETKMCVQRFNEV